MLTRVRKQQAEEAEAFAAELRKREEELGAVLHISPISPLYLPYISPYISPISPQPAPTMSIPAVSALVFPTTPGLAAGEG